MDTKPKIRLGSGKKRSESWMTASICISDAEAHSYTYNGKKYVNINVNIYDKANDYGKDVGVFLNEYKKDEAIPKANAFAPDPEMAGDLPF